MVAKGDEVQESDESEFGDQQMQTIIYRMDKNKVLLYSTGNSIQQPVINNNGKEYKNVYLCLTESCCSTAEMNATILQ